jgi:hypothetical protein
VSVILAGPHKIIENENTNEDHKIYVVLHADWSYNEWGKRQKREELC